MPFATTATLNIAFETGGPVDGDPVLLLHGWPDDVRTYDRVVPALHAAGFRTVVPYLRGFGDTSFLSKDTQRSGEMIAMAQHVLPGVGHFPTREAPDAVNKLVIDFLRA